MKSEDKIDYNTVTGQLPLRSEENYLWYLSGGIGLVVGGGGVQERGNLPE